MKSRYIIKNDFAFVGVIHGKAPDIPKKDLEEIKRIGDQYGYWYEGGGGDKRAVAKIFGDIKYKGSWDKKANTKVSGGENHKLIFVLFSNVKENNNVKRLEDAKGKTVFERALNSSKLWRHDNHRGLSDAAMKKLLIKFLKETGKYALELAAKYPSKENIRNFLTTIEDNMWAAWPNRGTKRVQQMAFDANSIRDKGLLKLVKKGVAFVGDGHIDLIEQLL